jgi:hypothetical protein
MTNGQQPNYFLLVVGGAVLLGIAYILYTRFAGTSSPVVILPAPSTPAAPAPATNTPNTIPASPTATASAIHNTELATSSQRYILRLR